MNEKTSIVGDRLPDGRYKFMLLQKDIDRLPIDVPTGSTAYIIDTGDYLIFEATSEQWFAQ